MEKVSQSRHWFNSLQCVFNPVNMANRPSPTQESPLRLVANYIVEHPISRAQANAARLRRLFVLIKAKFVAYF